MIDEKLIENEVRIRLLEKIAADINATFRHLDIKLDSQFKWTIGIMIAMFGGLIIAKLI
jgi:hypothetical protein